jgi:hypothetical protein
MLEDMQLRGLSARTQECYVAAVCQLADPEDPRVEILRIVLKVADSTLLFRTHRP